MSRPFIDVDPRVLQEIYLSMNQTRHGNRLSNISKSSDQRLSYAEKRRSEVLLAANALDSEIKNVKNLKRLSIGSLDLISDPEFEFTINNTSEEYERKSQVYRKSWSSRSSSSNGDENIEEKSSDAVDESLDLKVNEVVHEFDDINGNYSNDELSFVSDTKLSEDSIDATRLEYLHQNRNPTSDNFSDKVANEDNACIKTKNRILSGVGGFKTGNMPKVRTARRNLSGSFEKTKHGDNQDVVKRKLLWVPANKHPSVQPKNYLELVQDALHTININDDASADVVTDSSRSSNCNSSSEIISGSGSNFNNNSLDSPVYGLIRKTNKSNFLTRRPSRLRKSYTEYEEDLDESEHQAYGDQIPNVELEDQAARIDDCFTGISINHGKRVLDAHMSLKNLSDELTKLSVKAGLTDSDALTLARTLSMTSFDDKNDNIYKDENSSLGGNHKVEDDAFASNIHMVAGFAKPQSVSLRRSKFNTYRIKSGGHTSSTEGPLELHLLSGQAVDLDSGNGILQDVAVSRKSSHSEKGETPESFHVGTNTPMTSTNNEHTKDQNSSFTLSGDSDLLSTDSTFSSRVSDEEHTANSIYDHISDPTSNTVSGNGFFTEEHEFYDNESPSMDGEFSGASDLVTGKSEFMNNKNSNDSTDDFVNSPRIDRTNSQRRAAARSNHSKSRHSPIYVIKEGVRHAEADSSFGKLESVHNFDTVSESSSNEVLPNSAEASEPNEVSKPDISTSPTKKNPKSSKAKAGPMKKRLDQKLFKLFKRKSKVEAQKRCPIEKSNIAKSRVQVDSLYQPDLENDKAYRARSAEVVHSEVSEKQLAVQNQSTLQPGISVHSLLVPNDSANNGTEFTETINEIEGDESYDVSADFSRSDPQDSFVQYTNEKNESNELGYLNPPPRKLTFDDIIKPEKANAPIKFRDSSFGFPLPALTTSTVIMYDHRLGNDVERAIYRLSHLKLSDPKRELRQQVILSNFMYAYLNLVNHSLYVEQFANGGMSDNTLYSNRLENNSSGYGTYLDESYGDSAKKNSTTILIPDMNN